MYIKSIRQARALAGKRVFLRADFNVPIEKGKVEDDYKIMMQLPTVRFLLQSGCSIIIASHLGRPKTGRIDQKYSVKPIADKISELLSVKVRDNRTGEMMSGSFKGLKLLKEVIGFDVDKEVAKIKPGQIIMLENLRFEEGELKDDKKFAKSLAGLVDIYVNDAFAVSHRAQASVSAIKRYLPSYAGLLLEKEVDNLHKARRANKKLVVVIGGSKLATKVPLIKRFSKKADKILVGGALANNFLAAHDLEIGKSLADEESIKLAKKYKNKNIILPVDVVTSTTKSGKIPVVKSVNKVDKCDHIYDIGPRTIKLFSDYIKKSNVLIWNGPMGYFELKQFSYGTLSIAKTVASRSHGKTFGVVGGGETVEALKRSKMLSYVDWVSTGGGAMLSYLCKEKMPGLKGIVR